MFTNYTCYKCVNRSSRLLVMVNAGHWQFVYNQWRLEF